MSTAKQNFDQEAAKLIKSAEGLHGNTKIAQTAKVLKASIVETVLEAKKARNEDIDVLSGNNDGLGDYIQCSEGDAPDCIDEAFGIENGLITEPLDEIAGRHVDVETLPDENHTDLSIAEPDPSFDMG